MSDNDKKYETSNIDDIKALFDGRKKKRRACTPKPLNKGKRRSGKGEIRSER